MGKRSDHRIGLLDEIGGEPLEGSGFEDVAMEWGFAIPPGPEDPSVDISPKQEPSDVD
jgi:hypothetical protein